MKNSEKLTEEQKLKVQEILSQFSPREIYKKEHGSYPIEFVGREVYENQRLKVILTKYEVI